MPFGLSPVCVTGPMRLRDFDTSPDIPMLPAMHINEDQLQAHRLGDVRCSPSDLRLVAEHFVIRLFLRRNDRLAVFHRWLSERRCIDANHFDVFRDLISDCFQLADFDRRRFRTTGLIDQKRPRLPSR